MLYSIQKLMQRYAKMNCQYFYNKYIRRMCVNKLRWKNSAEKKNVWIETRPV